MLLVAEILFSIWFWKAEAPYERGVAGFDNGRGLSLLMIIVLKFNRAPSKEKRQMHKNPPEDRLNWTFLVLEAGDSWRKKEVLFSPECGLDQSAYYHNSEYCQHYSKYCDQYDEDYDRNDRYYESLYPSAVKEVFNQR